MALTARQRALLLLVAVVVGGTVAALLLGVPWGLGGAQGTASQRILISGSGRASVTVVQDGSGGTTVDVPLPYAVPVDRGTTAVAVTARPLVGTATLTCEVSDGSGVVLQRIVGIRDEAVRCGTVLRN